VAVAIGEVFVGLQRQLVLAVDGPSPRPADLDPPATERDRPILVAVANRDSVRVVPALRAHDVVDLRFHQLGQYAEPDADAQREQTLLRCPDQLAERLLHALREHGLRHGRLRDRYVATHGGSSFDLGRSPVTLPCEADEPGGAAVTSKFYELRDNLVGIGDVGSCICAPWPSRACGTRSGGPCRRRKNF
jgi:hypothetical protein